MLQKMARALGRAITNRHAAACILLGNIVVLFLSGFSFRRVFLQVNRETLE